MLRQNLRKTSQSTDEKTIQLKYLDMDKTEPPEPASHETQELPGSYSGKSPMVWIEKTIDTAPASGSKVTDFYRYIYETMRENKPYPILIDDAVEVVRICDMIRAGGMKCKVPPRCFPTPYIWQNQRHQGYRSSDLEIPAAVHIPVVSTAESG